MLLAPGLARKVLDSDTDSPEEKTLRAQLADGTRMCGRIEEKSHVAELVHRSYLAEALYHWTRSSGDSARS